MKKATLNGASTLDLDENFRLELRGLNLDADGYLYDLELRCFFRDKQKWMTPIPQLGPNPTSERPLFSGIDYDLVYCEKEKAFVLSGCNRAIIVLVETGVIQVEVALEFSVISSLNYLHVQPVESPAAGVLIVSEGTMDRFDGAIRRLWAWHPTGPIAQCAVVGEYVVVCCLDFKEVENSYGRTRIEIDSGRVVDFELTNSLGGEV